MISFNFYIYPGRRNYYDVNVTDEETESQWLYEFSKVSEAWT